MAVDKEKATNIGQSGQYLVNVNFDEFIDQLQVYGIFASAGDGQEDVYEEQFFEYVETNWHGVYKISSDLDTIQGMENVTTKMIKEAFGRDWESFLGGD